MSDDVRHWLGEGSRLGDSLAGFRHRPEQLAMAEAVEESLAAGDHLAVEAGTGTGKTLAYLVPVLLAGQKALISTGTRNLQDQLYHRDLPMLTTSIGRPVRIQQLKGRANYLCEYRLGGSLEDTRNRDARDLRELQLVDEWRRRTRSGDMAEVVGLRENSPILPAVTSTADNCLGADCPNLEDCFLVKARRAAQAADVVVVNHHLLMADMLLKDDGFGELLPEVEAVIVDEAHQFPEVAQNFFNDTLRSGLVRDLLRDIRIEAVNAGGFDPELRDTLASAETELQSLRSTLPRQPGNSAWNDLKADFANGIDALATALKTVADYLVDGDTESPGLERCRERLDGLTDQLERIQLTDAGEGLRWVGYTPRSFSLNLSPIDIAGPLGELLERQTCTWVFTSATLAVGDDFEHFLGRIGLPDARSLKIDSPFNYADNAMLFLPPGMPEPNTDRYTGAVLDRLLPLLELTNGRAFVLFTSHRALQMAAELLREAEVDYPLLVQGEMPRTRLLERFAELDNPVLLGTASFWEGVDMRGDALVLVVIDKLPFGSPGDPMMQVRLESIRSRGGNPFREHQLPQAVLGLKQGVGRLIRDYDDYGVVVVCDPRLTSKFYGKLFLESLPPFARTRDFADVEQFFEDRSS